jgi:hypothetical protein
MRLVCVLLLATVTTACGGYSAPGANSPGSGSVQIQQLMPAGVTAGSASFVLTVNGTGFAPGAVVYWNTVPQTTMYVTTKQVAANIPASLVTNPINASVYVRSNSINSNTVSFTVN